MALGQAIARNVPVTLRHFAREWPACKEWSGGESSRLRLKALAGSSMVEVMVQQQPLQQSASSSPSRVFYGDIRRRKATVMPFGDVVDYAWQKASLLSLPTARKDKNLGKEDQEKQRTRLYLAQAPIYSENAQEATLHALQRDVPEHAPAGVTVNSINLWLSLSDSPQVASRSSPHYDPHHNILCVVTGRKVVKLFSPDQTRQMHPQSITSDASNHPRVDFTKENLQDNPYSIETLEPGDALFIPGTTLLTFAGCGEVLRAKLLLFAAADRGFVASSR